MLAYISNEWPGILLVIGGILVSIIAGVCWGRYMYKEWEIEDRECGKMSDHESESRMGYPYNDDNIC